MSVFPVSVTANGLLPSRHSHPGSLVRNPAASATQPPARVQPGTVARVGVLARLLPDPLLDKGYDIIRKFTR